MRSVQVPKPKGPLEIVERDIPEPGARHVRIKIQECGKSFLCIYSYEFPRALQSAGLSDVPNTLLSKKYSLIDFDGREISPNELAGRYFSCSLVSLKATRKKTAVSTMLGS